MDKYHGQGGTYEVKNGERVLVKDSTLEHHEGGDGARDAKKNDVSAGAAEKTEPAMPAPQPAPWEAKPEPPKAGARAASESATSKGA